LTLGILSGQLPINARKTQLAADDLAGRARQVEAKMQENLLEERRLAAAIETLNSDRDRMFTRLSNLEQGLDVVTGSIKKRDDKPAPVPWPQAAAPVLESAPPTVVVPQAAPAPAPAQPVVTAPVSDPETTATAIATRSEPTSSEPAAVKPPSSVQAMPIPDAKAPAGVTDSKEVDEQPVAPASFAVDLGAANSLNGLRARWRGLVKSHRAQLEGLRPLIAVRERRNGLGLQLRLIAGPIKDAAAAAQICVALGNADRDCATAPFDGQRLSLASEPEERTAPTRAPKHKPAARRPPEAAQARAAEAKAEGSSLSSMLGIR
jgi:hypothetical protein